MRQQGFRDLIAWQKAYQLALNIYEVSRDFPKQEQYALTSQMQRSAISISANISEGYERQHRKEYVQFLSIARGSLGELETYLMFARDLGYISKEKYKELEASRMEI